MRLITPGGRSARSKGLQEGGGKLFVGARPRANARFRVSIEDNKTRRRIKVELIEVPGRWDERRYRLRLNGREPDHVKGEPTCRRHDGAKKNAPENSGASGSRKRSSAGAYLALTITSSARSTFSVKAVRGCSFR